MLYKLRYRFFDLQYFCRLRYKFFDNQYFQKLRLHTNSMSASNWRKFPLKCLTSKACKKFCGNNEQPDKGFAKGQFKSEMVKERKAEKGPFEGHHVQRYHRSTGHRRLRNLVHGINWSWYQRWGGKEVTCSLSAACLRVAHLAACPLSKFSQIFILEMHMLWSSRHLRQKSCKSRFLEQNSELSPQAFIAFENKKIHKNSQKSSPIDKNPH